MKGLVGQHRSSVVGLLAIAMFSLLWLQGQAGASRLATHKQAEGLKRGFAADHSHSKDAAIVFITVSKVNKHWGEVGYVVPPKRHSAPDATTARPKMIDVKTYHEGKSKHWKPAAPPPKVEEDLSKGDTIKLTFKGSGQEFGESTTTSPCSAPEGAKEVIKGHLSNGFTWTETWTYNETKPAYSRPYITEYLAHAGNPSIGTYDKHLSVDDDQSACFKGQDTKWQCTAQEKIDKVAAGLYFFREDGITYLVVQPEFVQTHPTTCTGGRHTEIFDRVDQYNDLVANVPLKGTLEIDVTEASLGAYPITFPDDLAKTNKDVRKETSHTTGMCKPSSQSCEDTLQWSGSIAFDELSSSGGS